MRLIRSGEHPVMSRSCNKMRPELGCSWPPIWLTRLVLPAPFGPMMTCRSPGAMSRLTSRSRQAAERFVEAVEAQHVHFVQSANAASCMAPHNPPGKNMTQQMKVTPMTASQCSL